MSILDIFVACDNFASSKKHLREKEIIHGSCILLEKIDNFLEERYSYGQS